MSSSDSTDPDEQHQDTHQASSVSITGQEGNLIHLSTSQDQTIMESTPDDAESSSADNSSSSKGKPSFVRARTSCQRSNLESLILRTSKQYTNVLGLWPLSRGSPQRPHPANNEQHDKTRSKFEEENMVLQNMCEKLRKDHSAAIIEIKRLGSKIELAEEQHKATKMVSRKKVEQLENGIKSTKELNEKILRRWKTAKGEKLHLESELETANANLHGVENAANKEIAFLTAKIEATEQELFAEKSNAHKDITQLQGQIKLLTEKNDKFRQMLIPVSEDQILDADVVQKFRYLRSSMLALVRRTWSLKMRDDFDLSSLSKDQHIIFKPVGTTDYDRLRYAVFYFIHQRIIGTHNYFLENGFEKCESGLRQVEKELVEKSPTGKRKFGTRNYQVSPCMTTYMPAENRKLVMEWRNASFKATKSFRGNGRRLSIDTQQLIWNFFGPLQKLSPAAEGVGRQKLEALCDAAVDLSLNIRQLKDNFWVDDMSRATGKPIAEWEQFAEEMASVPAGNGKQPGTIAYAITGALMKSPRENLEKLLVLEKAEVVVYRRETSQDT